MDSIPELPMTERKVSMVYWLVEHLAVLTSSNQIEERSIFTKGGDNFEVCKEEQKARE